MKVLARLLTLLVIVSVPFFFFFQAEDGIRDTSVTGVQTCALPIYARADDRLHPRERRAGALELDRVGACLLDEPHGVLDRGLVGGLEGAERHVGDHEDRKSVV